MLERRTFIKALLEHRGESIVISSLGNPTYDVAAAGDSPANFYFWGGMGGAAATGLGLALARPDRRVVVISGDGEMLMGLTSLATIAVQRPVNLAILVLDNQAFAETGSQTGLTASGLDLAAIAGASGFAATMKVDDMSQVGSAAKLLFETLGPVFVNSRIALGEQKRILPERDGAVLAGRTRRLIVEGEGNDETQ